jgi:hypothetical protein
MRNFRPGRVSWYLAVAVLSTPMVLPLAARNHSKKSDDTTDKQDSPEVAAIVDHIVASEKSYYDKLKSFSPRVETYVQYYEPNHEVGDVALNDAYFLGRLTVDHGAREVSFTESPANFTGRILHFPSIFINHLTLSNFAIEPLVVDDNDHFDRKHYTFTPVRWEYLGDVRCLAIDVHPRDAKGIGEFEGRIWVEDKNYSIVRLNGTRVHPTMLTFYVHFDCWRENLQPGVWLPVYVYSQEDDMGKRLRYKAETRLWGYDLTAAHRETEWTNIQVDAPAPIRDSSESASDMSPVESQRQLTIDAEHNILDRLEKARLIAPPGPVDKVLETVVNNLRVTNNLENMPPVHCRVMLTSSLEAFTLAYTIVISRGLVDVLPDEASLAMILSHELAQIALGQKLDTKYAFNDRTQLSDEALLSALDIARDKKDEDAADIKAIEFLKNSPYKGQLAQAGLFLQASASAAPRVPHLFGAQLGNGLTESNNRMVRMAALINSSPKLAPKKVDQIAALPLGSRLQVNAWDGSVTFTTRKAVALVDATEKMPFSVTPVIPYLRTYSSQSKVEVSSINTGR